jgi:hypothetical protein
MAPLIHWMPAWVRRALIPLCPRILLERPNDRSDFYRISLLDSDALARLFGDAEIWRERFLGLTKSLMAVKR